MPREVAKAFPSVNSRGCTELNPVLCCYICDKWTHSSYELILLVLSGQGSVFGGNVVLQTHIHAFFEQHTGAQFVSLTHNVMLTWSFEFVVLYAFSGVQLKLPVVFRLSLWAETDKLRSHTPENIFH